MAPGELPSPPGAILWAGGAWPRAGWWRARFSFKEGAASHRDAIMRKNWRSNVEKWHTEHVAGAYRSPGQGGVWSRWGGSSGSTCWGLSESDMLGLGWKWKRCWMGDTKTSVLDCGRSLPRISFSFFYFLIVLFSAQLCADSAFPRAVDFPAWRCVAKLKSHLFEMHLGTLALNLTKP